MENGDATAAGTADDSNSGLIRFEVDDISTLGDEVRFSPEIEVGGLPWSAYVSKVKYDDSEHLSVHINIENQCTTWSVDVTAHYTLVNADAAKNVTATHSKTFNYYNNIGGCLFNDLTWDELVKVEKGFIKNDTVVIEIRFTITNSKGIRLASQIDFTDANEPRHDVTLVIGGEKIYASKQILAVHSPFFNAMFYGNFDERNKTEVEIKEVDRNEFHELLRVVYPTDRKITDDTVEFLLKLGDRFQMKFLIDQAESHLMYSSNFERATILRISDDYRLIKLQDHCLNDLNSMEDLKEIRDSAEYESFSDATKTSLLERIFFFTEQQQL